jgi:hypothetical protein
MRGGLLRIDGMRTLARQNLRAILFGAEDREVILAEGSVIHPANGGALAYRSHRVLI